MILEFIENQTTEICLAAVNQNGWALTFVKKQTLEICMVAVLRGPIYLNLLNIKL